MSRLSPQGLKPIAAIAIALTLFSLPLGAQAAACKFSVVPSANPVPNGDDLFGVSSTAAKDAWAVGFFINAAGTAYDTLAEHWNGTTWSVVPSANPGSVSNFFTGTAAVSSHDAWAVGYYNPTPFVYQPLIEHWNGTAWSVVANPPTGTFYGAFLFGVTAISANNVWAVGTTYIGSNNGQTLIEHWNGSAWSIVTSPNVNAFNDQLASIVWNSANDIWAGGAYSPSSSQLGIHNTLTEHWNGSTWSIISSPNSGTSSNNINAMAAVSPTKVYGAGDFYTGTQFDTLGETWNGTSWAIKPTPNHGTNATEIFGMAGSRLSGALAVGQFVPGGPSRTFAMMLTPTGWKIVPSANVGANDNFFNGAGAIPGTDDAWGVGGTDNSNGSRHTTLIELFRC